MNLRSYDKKKKKQLNAMCKMKINEKEKKKTFIVGNVGYKISLQLQEQNVKGLDPVFQKMDSAIRWIKHYSADNTMDFVNTYPLDSDFSGG